MGNLTKEYWYVYILRCNGNSPYTGYTHDLNARLERHHKEYVISTKNKRPLSLETYFGVSDQYQAIEFEKYLKTGSGRAVLYKRFFKKDKNSSK